MQINSRHQALLAALTLFGGFAGKYNWLLAAADISKVIPEVHVREPICMMQQPA